MIDWLAVYNSDSVSFLDSAQNSSIKLISQKDPRRVVSSRDDNDFYKSKTPSYFNNINMEIYKRNQQEKWLKEHPDAKNIQQNDQYYQKGYDHPVLGHEPLVDRHWKRIDAREALENKVVGVYFAAHWNKECQEFTPKLISAYKSYIRSTHHKNPFEIVFVSSDETENDMIQFMNEYEMPWLAIPFHDALRKDTLMAKFHVNDFPRLAVLDAKGNDLTGCFGDNICDMISREGYHAFLKVISGLQT